MFKNMQEGTKRIGTEKKKKRKQQTPYKWQPTPNGFIWEPTFFMATFVMLGQQHFA